MSGTCQYAALVVLCLFVAQTARAQPFEVINTNDAGAGSLRQAILDANDNLGPDTITFNIPGKGPHVIQPIAQLPQIDESVVIDGYSQPGTVPNTAMEGSNAVIGVALDGSLQPRNEDASGLIVDGSGTQITGLSIVGWQRAIELQGVGGHEVRGNWIGIAPDGSAKGNRIGITVATDTCVIGGPTKGSPSLADRNVISNSLVAIGAIEPSDFTRIQNNAIGTDLAGLGPAGNGFGIVLVGRDAMVGGSGPMERNVVAWSRRAGVVAVGGAIRNTIRGNRIFNNGSLGIDLNTNSDDVDEVTENDPPASLDGDGGSNQLQNFPVLLSATEGGGAIAVTGTLDSAASTTFNIDFYSNAVRDNGPPDAGGQFHGEGEAWLGAIQVTTNINGHADFEVDLFGSPAGPWISATATDPEGNTGEFSATVPVEGEDCTVTNTNSEGKGSFDDCINLLGNNGNNENAVDRVVFNVPGGGMIPHNDFTAPFTPNLMVDFTTQPGYQPPTPGTDSCASDAVWPVTLNANFTDIDLVTGNIIVGMNLIGTVIVTEESSGVAIVDSTINASIFGPAMFANGNWAGVHSSRFTSLVEGSGVETYGSWNRFTDACSSSGYWIFGNANFNTFFRPRFPDSLYTARIFSGTGNTFSEINVLDPEMRAQQETPGGIMIDLGADGHTENDPLDADEGPNDLQNYPVIDSIAILGRMARGGVQAHVAGVLDSEPGFDYRIEAYASAACGPDDHGPAERYLGYATVTTDQAGHAQFLVKTMESLSQGEAVVVSSTGPWGSTSEFSACTTVEGGNPDAIFTNGFE